MELLISNATILTMDEAMHIHFGAHLGITGSKITYIGKDAPKEAPEKIKSLSVFQKWRSEKAVPFLAEYPVVKNRGREIIR